MGIGLSLKSFFRRLHIKWLLCNGIKAHGIELTHKTVIFAPHPDDEVIGCGGLIARLVAEGRPPHVVVMTGGGGSHRGCCSIPEADIIRARRGLTRDALAVLGLPEENIHELDYTDGDIHAGHPQTDELKALIGRLQPDMVFVPHWGEGWSDHIRTAEIVKELLDPDVVVVEYCVWMWYYNVWRGLDWKNALRVDLSPEEHALKLRAIDAYVVPKAPCGKPWSGVLPKIFIDANKGKSELYFKVRK